VGVVADFLIVNAVFFYSGRGSEKPSAEPRQFLEAKGVMCNNAIIISICYFQTKFNKGGQSMTTTVTAPVKGVNTVVRNEGYGETEFKTRQRHNERQNETYHNGDIVQERSTLNVHFQQYLFPTVNKRPMRNPLTGSSPPAR